MGYKPDGHPSVSPYLIVSDAARTIDFLVRVLDAKEVLRMPRPGGGIMHAEVRIDDSILMMGEGGPGWPPQPAQVHIYVPNVDDTYARALAAGATSLQEPGRKDDADKRAGVKDADGNGWWFATRIG